MQPYWPGAPPPPGPPPFTEQDANHLRLLSIFHYLYAGLIGLGALAFTLYVVLGAAMIAAPGTGGRDTQLAGGFLIAFGLVVIAVVGGKAVLLVMAGRALTARNHHTLCVVAAALSCLVFPLGMMLGIFSLVVLLKPGVKGEFDRVSARTRVVV